MSRENFSESENIPSVEPSNSATRIGDRLKQAIRKTAATQKDFVKITGISQSTLTGILKGKSPTARILEIITRQGISADWLITGQGEMLMGRAVEPQKPVPVEPQPAQHKVAKVVKMLSDFDVGELETIEGIVQMLLKAMRGTSPSAERTEQTWESPSQDRQ